MKLWIKFWQWPKAIRKLYRIREITSIYFNDSKMRRITEIIDEP